MGAPVARNRWNLFLQSGQVVNNLVLDDVAHAHPPSVASERKSPNTLYRTHLAATRLVNDFLSQEKAQTICYLTGAPKAHPGHVHKAHLVPHSETAMANVIDGMQMLSLLPNVWSLRNKFKVSSANLLPISLELHVSLDSNVPQVIMLPLAEELKAVIMALEESFCKGEQEVQSFPTNTFTHFIIDPESIHRTSANSPIVEGVDPSLPFRKVDVALSVSIPCGIICYRKSTGRVLHSQLDEKVFPRRSDEPIPPVFTLLSYANVVIIYLYRLRELRRAGALEEVSAEDSQQHASVGPRAAEALAAFEDDMREDSEDEVSGELQAVDAFAASGADIQEDSEDDISGELQAVDALETPGAGAQEQEHLNEFQQVGAPAKLSIEASKAELMGRYLVSLLCCDDFTTWRSLPRPAFLDPRRAPPPGFRAYKIARRFQIANIWNETDAGQLPQAGRGDMFFDPAEREGRVLFLGFPQSDPTASNALAAAIDDPSSSLSAITDSDMQDASTGPTTPDPSEDEGSSKIHQTAARTATCPGCIHKRAKCYELEMEAIPRAKDESRAIFGKRAREVGTGRALEEVFFRQEGLQLYGDIRDKLEALADESAKLQSKHIEEEDAAVHTCLG